ncbi:MAG: hypothetical protein JO134_22290 [Xanthobacteraceae bacterium]|nr:hypothetical protein [Xanthobacteraceae bacterium]
MATLTGCSRSVGGDYWHLSAMVYLSSAKQISAPSLISIKHMDGAVTSERDVNQEALELRKARRRERQRRYRKTEKGQAAHKRYWQSKKGKRTTKRTNRSPKRREAQKRYWSSLKGQQNRKRYRIRRKARQSETTNSGTTPE